MIARSSAFTFIIVLVATGLRIENQVATEESPTQQSDGPEAHISAPPTI